MESIEIEGKNISIFGSENTGSPLVILNTYGNECESVWNECQNINCPPFTLAAIGNLDWNNDMSPWENPALYKNDHAFSGGADAYISLLSCNIIPAICSSIGTKPSYIALSGYSLAGLFALYSAYKTDIFTKIASASGSLWFPGFEEYAESHDFIQKPDCIYLSLGDTEASAKNKVLCTVQDNTEHLFELYKSKDIPITFELNKGNHFSDTTVRTARGIKWILEH